MQAIPCTLIRGGSSRGAYFQADDLPADVTERNELLVRIMGGPDGLQVDGIGGGHPLTSKVAVLSPATAADADVNFLFLQIDPQRQTVGDTQNCGNILAGVGVYAIAKGWVACADTSTAVRVRMLNSGDLCHLEMPTPNGELQVDGDVAIDGVPGTSAPIICNYLDVAGSMCGTLLPTGKPLDVIDNIPVTCIDNGMPVVVMPASNLGIVGTEPPEELDQNGILKAKLESIRLKAGRMMNLGDVTGKSVPKLTLVSSPQAGGLVMTRTFIPHVCHKTIGVLGAVSVATACLLQGTAAAGVAQRASGGENGVQVEHPQGSLTVRLAIDDAGNVQKAGVIRTARLLFDGEVYV